MASIPRALAHRRAKFYTGIGVDIPKGTDWGTEPWPSDATELDKAVKRSFEAGAAGIVISREYEEMTLGSLKVIGRTVGEVIKG